MLAPRYLSPWPTIASARGSRSDLGDGDRSGRAQIAELWAGATVPEQLEA